MAKNLADLTKEYKAKNYELARNTSKSIENAVEGLEEFRLDRYFYFSFKAFYLGLKGNVNDFYYSLRKIKRKVQESGVING